MSTALRAVVLDTDVASGAYKRKPLPILNRITGLNWAISFVTYGEMVKWAEMRDWAPHNRDALATWLERTPTLHSTPRIAETWGKLSAAATKRGRPRPQNDMWVAAVALTYGLPLATLNVKDHEDFAEYHGLRLVTV